jgi:hypothetical protein
VLGNLLYGTAIVVYSTDYNYLIEHLPWIYGSFFIMLLDSIVSFSRKLLTYLKEIIVKSSVPSISVIYCKVTV